MEFTTGISTCDKCAQQIVCGSSHDCGREVEALTATGVKFKAPRIADDPYADLSYREYQRAREKEERIACF